jgi:hypothetical protein
MFVSVGSRSNNSEGPKEKNRADILKNLQAGRS